MKYEVWGVINDLGIFLNMDQIKNLKKEGKLNNPEIEKIVDYWITEHEEYDDFGNRKIISDEDWQVKYNEFFKILKEHLIEQVLN